MEYQGPSIRVGLVTKDGIEAAAILRDTVFNAHPVSPGDEVTLSWPASGQSDAGHPADRTLARDGLPW